MSQKTDCVDVLIIGAGPAGYVISSTGNPCGKMGLATLPLLTCAGKIDSCKLFHRHKFERTNSRQEGRPSRVW